MQNKIIRLIDANCNRAMEGLRVCEDTMRFVYDNSSATAELKRIRHLCGTLCRSGFPFTSEKMLFQRDITRDVGKRSIRPELKRSSCRDIFFANIQRVKESLRVLEEFSKILTSKDTAQQFKGLRYHIYELEKKAAARI